MDLICDKEEMMMRTPAQDVSMLVHSKELIPGSYKINILKEPTPLTMGYRQRFDWFKFHLVLTRGSEKWIILPEEEDDQLDWSQVFVTDYRRFYLKASSALDRDEDINLKIE